MSKRRRPALHLAAIGALLFIGGVSGTGGQSAEASAYPAAVAAGNWVADVKMSSTIAKTPQKNYWWVGRMWGRIDETGKVFMRADNGCVVSGVFTDRALQGLRGEFEFTDCQDPTMNRRYRATASGVRVDSRSSALRMKFHASQNGGGPGLLDSWDVEGAFAGYQPAN